MKVFALTFGGVIVNVFPITSACTFFNFAVKSGGVIVKIYALCTKFQENSTIFGDEIVKNQWRNCEAGWCNCEDWVV